MDTINKIVQKTSENYDSFIMNCFVEYGYDIEAVKQSMDNNLCIIRGNDRHFFVDGKYVFSITHSLEYPSSGNLFKYDMCIKSYYDENMIDYDISQLKAES